ncbi:MAG: hypothetical protein CME88_05750 [Hirschia sp.]|nr:hypothetical protein [Hirschia sp.]MBF17868.1 hypothetical protein [Hirschia sp.]
MCAPMPELSGNVLLLEDNLIVSLDVEEILKELGAQNVYSADTVKDALGLVDAHSYSFALLDVKLSDGDVFPVADRLLQIGVRICFATGHGDADFLKARYPGVAIIDKPYSKEDILALLQ